MPGDNDLEKIVVEHLLDSIRSDIDRIDQKWETQLVQITQLKENLSQVSSKVHEINDRLTRDNGKPSVLTQLRDATNTINDTKVIVDDLRKEVANLSKIVSKSTPKEVVQERWKTAGKVAAAAGLVLPGIVSFIHQFLS